MNGLFFETSPPVVASAPTRTDIACFVGFARRRERAATPAALTRWWREHNWSRPEYAERVNRLLDVPVPIDNWTVFDRLFAWDDRPLAGQSPEAGPVAVTYLGAAVRSFFAQGGRKCYVVRIGDPWPYGASATERLDQSTRLIREQGGRAVASATDRDTWRGAAHVLGLPDVSFLCLPDLPDMMSATPDRVTPLGAPAQPEEFVACSERQTPLVQEPAVPFRAPACDDAGFDRWSRVIGTVLDLVRRSAREVQVVAALPLAAEGSRAGRHLASFLTDGEGALSRTPDASGSGLGSAFLQLGYPWVRTPGSAMLPGRLEPPDSVLAGLLARNAISRGTFHSAAGLELGDAYAVEPVQRRDQFSLPQRDGSDDGDRAYLWDRVSFLGPTPRGLELLSDVTTSLNTSHRPANVNRLISVIVRASRLLGEEIVFEPNGEALWARLRRTLENLLAGLWHMGALRGATAQEAFHVRCDRSTMRSNDIENGRLIARIRIAPATAIERIDILLTMDEGGRVSLVSPPSASIEAA